MSTTTNTSAPGAERILEVAEACFAERGFAATSIQEIARRAGVSRANVFHHFRSKENLYLTCCAGPARVLPPCSMPLTAPTP